MLKMTATCLIILVLATVGQAGAFADCVSSHLLSTQDDPVEHVKDLLAEINAPLSDADAEQAVSELLATDCSAVDATLLENSLNSADQEDILRVAIMEDIHTLNSAVANVDGRRELMVVAAYILVGVVIVFVGVMVAIEASKGCRRMRRSLSTGSEDDVIITAGDLMAGCGNVGDLSDVCNVPLGDLSADFSTALCGGPSAALECDVSLASVIGTLNQGMGTETALAMKNDRLRKTNRALVKRFKELSMN
jgi:hypothetical protein